MPKKSITIWTPDKVIFDLSMKDHIIFLDREEGKGISMKLTQFFKIVDIVKEEIEKGKI